MTDGHESTEAAPDRSIQPTAADAVTNPAVAPMDDAAGGPTADKEQTLAPSDQQAADQPAGQPEP